MKYVKYFLIVFALVIGLSFNTTRTSRLSESIYPGNLFPDIKNLENVSGTSINLSDLKGQMVLVNFWASYDATSHKDNVLLSNIIAKNDYPVKMVSISFDKNEAVYSKTLELDKIDETYQFLAKDRYAELFNSFQFDKGFRSYLIDTEGRIVAMNLKANELDQLLYKN